MAGRAERDGGFLASASGNDAFALSYFEGEDLPVYDLMARRFTVCDRWHASVLGPTYPEPRVPALRAVGRAQGQLPAARRGRLRLADDRRPARRRERHDHGVLQRPPAAAAVGRPHDSAHAQDGRRSRTDAAAGKLPSVSIVTPAFVGDRSHRRPSARRPARGAAVRTRRVRGVREVTAVGARPVRAHVRRVGWLLRPRRAADPPRPARERQRRGQLRTGGLPRADGARVAVRPARVRRPHAVRPHVDPALPRMALPRRAAARTGRSRRRSGSSPHATATPTISARRSRAARAIPTSGSTST